MIKIGQQFAEERKAKNLTLEEVSKSTKIREEFLRAIERGDFKALPGASYAYGFVRNYAKFLGLPVEKSLALFRREFDDKRNIEVLPRGFTNPREYSISRFKIGRNTLVILGILVLITGFIIFQYRAAIFNPALSVDYPPQGATLKNLNIEVRGKTDPDATLTINGLSVTVDESGVFRKGITAFPGNIIIDVRAENKFGKVSEVKREVTLHPGF